MTKKIAGIFLLSIIFSCTTKDKLELMIGTWRIDNNPEYYQEVKIGKNSILELFLSPGNNHPSIEILKSRIENNFLYIENKKGSPEIDTFKLVCQSRGKIILKRKLWNQYLELSKIKNEISKVDSTNLKQWKEKTISDFRRRVKINLGNDFDFDKKIDPLPDVKLDEQEEKIIRDTTANKK